MSAAGHGLGLPEDEQVLKIEGVVPEVELVVIAQGEAEEDASPGQECRPGPSEKAVEEQGQQSDGKRVEQKKVQMLEVGGDDLVVVGPGGQNQQDHAHAQAGAEEHKDTVREIGDPLPLGPGGVQGSAQKKESVQKRVQKVSAPVISLSVRFYYSRKKNV